MKHKISLLLLIIATILPILLVVNFTNVRIGVISNEIINKELENDAPYSSPDIREIKELVDKTKKIKDFACADALEGFYADDNYTYCWSCLKNEYMVVKYNDGYEETISEALNKGVIKITDLDQFNIEYIKYEKY